MTTQYILSDTQRMLLARIAFGEPYPFDRRWIDSQEHGRDVEALVTLRTNRYIRQERIDRDWYWVTTEIGQQFAEAAQERAKRARVQTCPCCVVLSCVCSVRTGCRGDGPHDVGCHGTHD